MSRMNRETVSSSVSLSNSYSSSIFSTKQAQTEGINELIVKKLAARLTAEAQEKLKKAAGQVSIGGLGALTDTSA